MSKAKKKTKKTKTEEELFNIPVTEDQEDIDDVVEEIYDEAPSKELQKGSSFAAPFSSGAHTFKNGIFAAVIGLVAGITGMIWFLSGTWPFSDFGILFGATPGAGVPQIRQVEQVNVSFEEQVSEVSEQARTSVVQFVKKSAPSEDGEGVAGWPLVHLGWGTVITNDGLILTTPAVFTGQEETEVFALTYDGQLHELVLDYTDFLEPVAYVKIAGDNMLPAQFARGEEVAVGQSVFMVDPGVGSFTTSADLARVRRVRHKAVADGVLVTSRSEVHDSRTLIDMDLEADDDGMPLFGLDGEVVGMVVLGAEGVREVLGSAALESANQEYVGTGEISRTWLGVHYLDLSHAAGLPEELTGGSRVGALLYSLGDVQAVEDTSPADVAGLENKDIILEVESQEVNGRHDLTELVQSYKPGQEVTLIVLREGEKLGFTVRLGELK